ncbi:type II toxin-antitoxin system VapC family toxin [Nocardioides sp. R-C-SC26]|uniref:type II toxin-antitoxin system VapC family toxin n=1 Tax=Nocardioides sp. R-C-SC26 TaxID=2870414 RepID=UPI001E6336FD|nr:type II toxin-antitoxin system VapC family toxin [Nocardioides sp. R-C-SC26]
MTIALDTSAIAAVVFGEPDATRFVTAMLANAGDCLVSAATLVEAGIVVEAKQGPAATQDLRLLLDQIGVEVVAVDSDAASVAVGAWQRFGKGRHPAALNLGDCFAYAVAKIAGAPLLFKGDDFAKTDIPHAI